MSDTSELPTIDSMFATCDDTCPVCHGDRWVCEDHPNKPWRDGDGCCGGAGMPCPGVVGLHA